MSRILGIELLIRKIFLTCSNGTDSAKFHLHPFPGGAYSYIRVLPDGFLLKSCLATALPSPIQIGPAPPLQIRYRVSVFFYPAEYLLNINCFNSNSSLARVSKLYGFVYETITKEFKVLHALVFVICFFTVLNYFQDVKKFVRRIYREY